MPIRTPIASTTGSPAARSPRRDPWPGPIQPALPCPVHGVPPRPTRRCRPVATAAAVAVVPKNPLRVSRSDMTIPPGDVCASVVDVARTELHSSVIGNSQWSSIYASRWRDSSGKLASEHRESSRFDRFKLAGGDFFGSRILIFAGDAEADVPHALKDRNLKRLGPRGAHPAC